MADSPKNTPKAHAQDNLGQSGTDHFPTYQDEAGLTAAGKKDLKPAPAAEKFAPVELDHGQESPAAKAEREAAEKADAHASLGLPAQMQPENQDETVK